MDRRKIGQHYEELAGRYLEQRGLQLIERNYNCRYGEIDLVMLDGDFLCFIEVKFRKNGLFGGSAYSLPIGKQQKIARSAQDFISRHRRYRDHPMRFDAVLLEDGPQATDHPSVNWIRNAFDGE